jgi:hypothetical protein
MGIDPTQYEEGVWFDGQDHDYCRIDVRGDSVAFYEPDSSPENPYYEESVDFDDEEDVRETFADLSPVHEKAVESPCEYIETALDSAHAKNKWVPKKSLEFARQQVEFTEK